MTSILPPDLTWQERVRNSLEDKDELLRLLSEPDSRIRVTGGFYAGGSTKPCFAELCLRMDRMDVLEEVLEAAPGGITLDDLCTRNQLAEDGPTPLITHTNIVPYWSLAVEAVNLRVDPRMMRLALRFSPGHESLQAAHSQLDGASVHYHALLRAMKATDPSVVASLFHICERLREAKAPVAHARPEGLPQHVSMRLLASTIWTAEASPGAEGVLRAFVDAGVVELSGQAQDVRGLTGSTFCTPLELAILSGNGHGAAAFLRAGSPLEPSAPGRTAPFELARRLAIKKGGKWSESVALVTEAFMKRRIDLTAAAAPDTPTIRSKRAGL